ncbi:MAG: DoxX family protein [Saprospiraceae bacterium]|nr:DoxX family protein [Saprospiraceae bacterium]MBK9630690.1 DoxX family protein [Saprospiraceae bacterium]
MNPQTKTTIGWVLTGLLAAFLTFSAFGKLTGAEEAVKGFESMKLNQSHLLLAGIVEISAVILFIIPRTGVIGLLLMMAYLGATVIAHLQLGYPIYLNLAIAIAAVLIGNLRFPEIGNRLLGK